MSGITTGEIITIIFMIFGFIVQYGALIIKFSERITRIETRQEELEKNQKERHNDFKDTITKDIDALFHAVRHCKDRQQEA